MNNFFLKVKDYHIYIFVYFLSNFFLLINYQGVYWDDWVAYSQDTETLSVFFGMIQHGIKGDFYLIFSKYFNHIYLFRIFVVIAYGSIGYFTYKILLSTEIFNKSESKLIAFVSLILPIYSSLISIAIVPFLFPVLLFYLAFYLLAINYKKCSTALRIIILFIFFMSFSTNSLLVFYAIVLLYLFYMEKKSTLINLKFINNFISSKIDFIILPIGYFTYKILFLQPYGLYANYNHITIVTIKNIPLILENTFYDMTIGMINYIVNNTFDLYIILALSLILMISIKIKEQLFEKNKMLLLVLSGILFILAVFPYAAVSKTPVLLGWNSRFSLLMGIALSMFFIGIIALVSKLFFKYKNHFFVFSISFFILLAVLTNVKIQYQQNIDWFYQMSIVENMKENSVIKNNTTFIVENKIYNNLVYKRRLVYYEWNGLLKKAFGDTKRLMIPPWYIKMLSTIGTDKSFKQYNFNDWDNNQNFIKVQILNNKLDSWSILNLYINYIFNYEVFKIKVKKLIKIDIIK